MQLLKLTKHGDEGRENINLPQEIWSEIFYKLPMKSLLQSRCVNKHYLSITDSPDFSSVYLTQSKNNLDKNHLLLLEINGRKGCFGIVFKVLDKFTLKETAIIAEFSKYTKFWGYCNGLVLLQDIRNCNLSLLRLWNPSLRRSVILPPCPFLDLETRFVLGFDSCKGDYKVLAFRIGKSVGYDNMKWSSSVAIYSCNDRLWRVKPDLVVFHRFSVHSLMRQTLRVQYCKGVAYWRASSTPFVVLFDFSIEEFRFMKFPDTRKLKSGTEMVEFLFVLGDSIALFGISASISCIFVMSKNCGKCSWVLRFYGTSCLDSYEFFQQNRFSRIFYDDRSGDTLFVLKFGALEMKLTSYNLTSHQFKEFGRVFNPCVCWADTYEESLVLFKEFNGQTSRSCP